MVNSSKTQLLLICFISIAALPVIILSDIVALNTIFAFITGLFLPGYLLLIALYPRRESLGGTERFLLSFALSLAVVPLILLVLNYVWSLELIPCIIAVTVFNLLMVAVGWWRQRRLPAEERFAVSLSPLAEFNVTVLFKSIRFYLWVLLIGLTTWLLCSPLQLTLQPFAVESLHIFRNLPLFAGVFIAWFLVLIFLMFSKSPSKLAVIEKVALSVLVALVFNGFWIINSLYGFGSDSMANLADVNLVVGLGKLPPLGDLNYSGYPGATIIGSFFTQASGLTTFATGTVFCLETSIIAAALLALFLVRTLKNPNAAMLALLLIVIVAAALSPASVPSRALAFRADIFSGVFWLSFITLLFRSEEEIFTGIGEKVIVLLLLAATTIFYANHSFVIVFVIFSIFIVARLAKDPHSIEPAMLYLPLVLAVLWSLYIATGVFKSVTRLLPSFLDILFAGEFLHTFQKAAGGPGAGVPFWMPLMSYIRWAFYGLGTLITVAGLFFIRKMGTLQRRIIGTVFGIGVFTMIFMFLEAQGVQVTRYIAYAPVFLSPLLIGLLFKFSRLWKRILAGMAIVVLFVFSLPSFLVYYGGNFNTYAVTEGDIAAGEFLGERYGSINELTVYSNRHFPDVTYYYLPDAAQKGPRVPSEVLSENDLWLDVDNLVSRFNKSDNPGLFVFSERASLLWYHETGILPDDEQWQLIKNELEGEDGANLVFSNDYVQVYANPAAVALSSGSER
ncbi:MAG: DUF1616 domain-containing protein [Dehalococcoidales bacterium]|nr:DUF1616 domain-containing protein [Dehalococcoidales bacterium]